QQVADPQTLYNFPANRFVAGFIGTPPMNFFAGEITGQNGALQFREKGGTTPFVIALAANGPLPQKLEFGSAVVLGVRPEHIADGTGDDVGTTLEARVEFIEPTGAETYLHLATSAHHFIARVAPGFAPVIGSAVRVRFDPAKARWFNPQTGAAIV
ncbi:MAG TPA: TOBE domain-containing protein, partial [Verrucomicrobiae bacterium]|nr:TOBE domain-containing protein [Verrucomicrobiae bacterium]